LECGYLYCFGIVVIPYWYSVKDTPPLFKGFSKKAILRASYVRGFKMKNIRQVIFSLFITLSFSLNANADSDNKNGIKAMQAGGHILMIRHANAPGFGDPDNIKVGDCSTQRNLDDLGRQQSKNIGDWLRSNKIEVDAVYSSQWCRCMDTANLIAMAKVEELPALNSFFQKTENKEPNIRDLKAFISSQDQNQKLIVMVTHQVTISALSGKYVTSGEGVLFKIGTPQSYEVVGVVGNEWLQ